MARRTRERSRKWARRRRIRRSESGADLVPNRHPTLLGRIGANFGWKVLLFLTLGPGFTVFYYVPQWLPIFAPGTIPLTAIDKAISFHPWWIWPYMSMYVMLPIPPMLA